MKIYFHPLLFRRRLFHLKALFRRKSHFLAGETLRILLRTNGFSILSKSKARPNAYYARD